MWDRRTLFLLLIFPMSIIVDNLNGYLQLQMGLHLPIGVAMKTFIIFLLIPSLWHRMSRLVLFIMLPIFIFVFLYWSEVWGADIMIDFRLFLDLLYVYLFINYFYVNIGKYDIKQLMNYVSIYGLMCASIIILCFVLGIGNHSYGEDYGFGTKGFFKAGNDVSLTMLFTLVFSMVYYLKYSSSIYRLIICYIIALGMILIGSRIGMILSTVFIICFMIYLMFTKRNIKNKIMVRIGILLILFVGISKLYTSIYGMLDDYALARFTMNSMQNARTGLIVGAEEHINEFDGLAIIIGKGTSSLFAKVASKTTMINDGTRHVEADIYEIIGSYGYVLGCVIMFFFYYLCFRAFGKWIRNMTLETFLMFTLAVLFVFIGALAGHAIRNVMIAPIYGIMSAIVLSNNIFEKNTIKYK